jgi:two-component system alkaline phosphatase synthesis response regulator PhoP
MLTGRAEDSDTVIGLEIGADDYVVKPFNLNELAARVRAVLRRSGPEAIDVGGGAFEEGAEPPAPTRLVAADVEMDVEAKRVWVGEEEVQLTPTEFKLLQTLLENKGKVVSPQDLLKAAWGYEDSDTHLVEVHVGNLRAKIEENTRRPKRVKTVRGFGYRVDDEEA